MASTFNLKGTSNASFQISKNGPRILQGTTDPDGTTGTDGDIYIRKDGANSKLFFKSSSTWTETSSSGSIGGLTPADGNFIVGDGTDFVEESGNVARSSLGLGTADDVQFTSAELRGSSQGRLKLRHSSAGVDEKQWDIVTSGGNLTIRSRTDADGAGQDAITIDRTADSVDNIKLRTGDENRLEITNQGGIIMGDSANMARSAQYIMRRVTTNASTTEMFLDGISQKLIIPDNTSWLFEIKIIARRTDATDESAAFWIEGAIDRSSGAATTALIGDNFVKQSEDSPIWDVIVDADTTNGALRIRVDGETGKTIRWVAFIRVVEANN